MKTAVKTVRDILRHKRQWIVPVYQRHYEWDSIAPKRLRAKDAQIPKLWETMEDKALESLGNRTKIPHYFGAIICANARKEDPDLDFDEEKIRYDYLVDGQQRVTSFQIALIAIREVAKFHRVPDIVDEANEHIFNREMSDSHATSRDDFKLRPSKMDRSLFEAIALKGFEEFTKDHVERFNPKNNQPRKQAEKIIWAYWTLYQEIKQMVEQQGEVEGRNAEEVLDALLSGFLDGFRVVIIRLGEEDDAQEIFASLNDLGKPLSPFDLVRNDIFLRARKEGSNDWETLLDQKWEYFENAFWHQDVRRGRIRRPRAEDLIAHVVVAETARQIGAGKIATEYRRHVESRGYTSVDEEVKVLKKHADNYRNLEEYASDYRDTNPVTGLAKVFDTWDTSIFHPLVLWVCYHVEDEEVQKNIFDLIEAFMIRREICGITENYNKLVPPMIGKMGGESGPVSDPVYALREYITNLAGSTNKMPQDRDILEAFERNPTFDSTPSRRIRHILVKLEYATRSDFGEKEILDESNLTLEHIMPQSWAKEWPLPNGKHAATEWIYDPQNENLDTETREMTRRRNAIVYTYGNLTLLTNRLNPSVSNRGWKEKRQAIADNSRLALNRGLVDKEVWDEEAIEERAKSLAKIAIDIWKFTPTG